MVHTKPHHSAQGNHHQLLDSKLEKRKGKSVRKGMKEDWGRKGEGKKCLGEERCGEERTGKER